MREKKPVTMVMVTDELQNIDQNNEVECYTVVSIVAVWELIKPIYDSIITIFLPGG